MYTLTLRDKALAVTIGCAIAVSTVAPALLLGSCTPRVVVVHGPPPKPEPTAFDRFLGEYVLPLARAVYCGLPDPPPWLPFADAEVSIPLVGVRIKPVEMAW